MMSVPLALFSAMSPLYEDSVKLGASFTSPIVMVTPAVAVSPGQNKNKKLEYFNHVPQRSALRDNLLQQKLVTLQNCGSTRKLAWAIRGGKKLY